MKTHQPPTHFAMAEDNRFWLITQKVLFYSPWLWLALLVLFVVGVTGQQGAWPSYGQPDPKDAGYLSLLLTPLILLMMWTLASLPFGLLFTSFALWKGAPYSISKTRAWFYLLGTLLFLTIVVGDFASIMTWLMD